MPLKFQWHFCIYKNPQKYVPAGQWIPAWNHSQKFIIFAGPDTGMTRKCKCGGPDTGMTRVQGRGWDKFFNDFSGKISYNKCV